MRRSVREAAVGFTLLAAIAGTGLFWVWLRGLSLSSRLWRFQVNFENASGLAVRSAVTYRGVQIGNVSALRTTPTAVVVDVEINDPGLKLPLPVVAQVQSSSLLGGDAVVALLTPSKQLPPQTPGPQAADCNRSLTVCQGMTLQGQSAADLTSVTAAMQELLDQADRQQLVPLLAKSARSFDTTAQDASRFMEDGRQLVKQLEAAVKDAQPTLDNLNASTAHIRNLTRALDNPKTVNELTTTVSNAEQLTARWKAVGGDVEKLTADPRFMDGVRNVAVGLGQFFEELYPAQTGAARDKAARDRAAREKAAGSR